MTNTESLDLHKIEALLFAASRFVPLEEISKAAGLNEAQALNAIDALKQKYTEPNTALTLIEEGKSWKLSVKDEFLPLMQKVVKTTEFEKPLMETLAVIAWKYPALQCDIVKIRHNKAYDHLRELEERGFITRTKYGRTRKISLTQKFFGYFDLPSRKQAQEAFREIIPDEVKDRVEETERHIEESEKVIEETKKVQEEAKNAQEGEKSKEKEVDLVDDEGKPHKLEEYEKKEEEKVEVYEPEEEGQKLETYETTPQPEEEAPEEKEEAETEPEEEEKEETEEKEKAEEEEKPTKEAKEEKPTEEEKVEERIEEMLHPEKEEKEKQEESTEEPKEEQPEEEK